MIIGNFTYNPARDSYTGFIDTLTVSRPAVTFRPTGAKDGKAPGYRVEVSTRDGLVELGAAWQKRSEEGRDYLSVKLDDPALATPINCALVGAGEAEGFNLVWSRDSGRRAKAA
jgi:uncharacterized protein (DUF736 family)